MSEAPATLFYTEAALSSPVWWLPARSEEQKWSCAMRCYVSRHVLQTLMHRWWGCTICGEKAGHQGSTMVDDFSCLQLQLKSTFWQIDLQLAELNWSKIFGTQKGLEGVLRHVVQKIPSAGECAPSMLVMAHNFSCLQTSTFEWNQVSDKKPCNQGTGSAELCALILFSHNWFSLNPS